VNSARVVVVLARPDPVPVRLRRASARAIPRVAPVANVERDADIARSRSLDASRARGRVRARARRRVVAVADITYINTKYMYPHKP
jgi:hypothetical protein